MPDALNRPLPQAYAAEQGRFCEGGNRQQAIQAQQQSRSFDGHLKVFLLAAAWPNGPGMRRARLGFEANTVLEFEEQPVAVEAGDLR